ncbi:cyclopropane-fatty-acyl-phospholipid synthase family protein [Breoghania sp. L-A4]|uniref:SAM-dependent methyltransferase n=1 Tax=Breoghania sp. L-A4 TaxID=2304600 RepID=UPI000E35A26D|nr:cyclopropane-fatty-acyl-phospholipid synthase family protein [Breoghania sp. L-A4]AXS40710.1 class I SAM-dependent methyltransferase [Breoghania sp. L-A4]
MAKFVADNFERVIRRGQLRVQFASAGGGEQPVIQTFGDGTGKPVAIRFNDQAAQWKLLLNPEYQAGDLFMHGRIDVLQGSIYDFLAVVLQNTKGLPVYWWMRLLNAIRIATRRLRQRNTLVRSRKNVAHHYDLDGSLYRLFLDSDCQYSCAYFERPGDNLETAQLAKKRHLAAKLALKSGQKVLDIGSGWGGLGLYLAEIGGVDVTGLTLSTEQHQVSNARAHELGLDGQARFKLQDYRATKGPFDRIVSVGMFEHVGIGNFDAYFNTCRDLLEPDGVMILHSIGRMDGPGATNPWIDRYIFPGGYIPALSEVLLAIERAGLKVTDIEILRLHYAETLRAWRERFMARRDEAEALYDEQFCRMWEFYLAASETAFRFQNMMVFQIQLVRDQEALPLTRAYIAEAEEELRRRENGIHRLRLAGE